MSGQDDGQRTSEGEEVVRTTRRMLSAQHDSITGKREKLLKSTGQPENGKSCSSIQCQKTNRGKWLH